MKNLCRILLTYASTFAMVVAVVGGNARSMIIFHEPKVPLKLRRY